MAEVAGSNPAGPTSFSYCFVILTDYYILLSSYINRAVKTQYFNDFQKLYDMCGKRNSN